MKRYSYFLFAIVLMLASLGQVVSDIYLPSLPFISAAMQVSSHAVQLSLFSFMLSFAISQLFYGPLSDAIGRKKPLLLGLCLCLAGSVICATAHNITAFSLGRLVQGLGAGAGLALSRSVMRDIFTGTGLAKVGSYLGIANIAVITGAPFLGGYLQHWFDWRASFIFLMLYTVAVLVVVLGLLPETNAYRHRDHLRWQVVKQNFMALLGSRQYRCYAMIIALAYASVLAWLTAGPILLQKEYGVSPIGFSWLCLLIGVILASGSLLNARLLNRFVPQQLARVGTGIMCAGGFLIVIVPVVLPANAWTVFIPVAIFTSGTSLTFSNSFACALMPFGKIAGIAGAITGFLQIFGGVVASFIISVMPDHNALPMGGLILLFGLIMVWLSRLGQRQAAPA